MSKPAAKQASRAEEDRRNAVADAAVRVTWQEAKRVMGWEQQPGERVQDMDARYARDGYPPGSRPPLTAAELEDLPWGWADRPGTASGGGDGDAQ